MIKNCSCIIYIYLNINYLDITIILFKKIYIFILLLVLLITLFSKMLRFSKKNFNFFFVKETKEYMKIFYFSIWKIPKLINFLIDICGSCHVLWYVQSNVQNMFSKHNTCPICKKFKDTYYDIKHILNF